MKEKDNSRIVVLAGIRSTLIGIAVSILLAAVKGIAGVLGNSYALIADAIESISDVITAMIVLLGLSIASKPPDKDHPYGHGKAEPIAAAIVAFALFGAALLIIIQSIHEIITPHHAPEPFTLIVLITVVIVKEILFRYVIKVGTLVESIVIKNDAWHHRSDAITSAAAFVGISIALIGGEGYEEADDWAALAASVIIIINASHLLSPALMEIMDTAPSPKIVDNVRKVARNVEGVIDLEKCYVRKMGFNFYIDIHVIVDGKIPVSEGHKIAHRVKDKLIASNSKITDVLVHIEPD